MKNQFNKKFDVLFLDDAAEFIADLDAKTQNKILYNIHKAQVLNDNELFKKLNSSIWEFRTLYNHTYYRLFAFWDTTSNTITIVVATHGLIKKTNKTTVGDLEKAERSRVRYFNEKLKTK